MSAGKVEMPEQVPQIGVVGCGYWGKNLIRNFSELGSLRAICDVDGRQLQNIQRSFAVPSTQDFGELLAMPGIQCVAIAAPAAQHFELAERALKAGKDVLVEKPLALSIQEGQKLVDLAHSQGRILMVGHLLQYHPAVLELKRLISSGELGKIHYIYSNRLNLGKLRTEENILWSFAPHDVSVILYLLGEVPIRVAAHGGSYLNPNVRDVTITTLEFASDVKAHIFVSWLHPFKEQKLVVVADHKMAVFDDGEAGEKLVLYPHRIEWLERAPVARKAEGQPVPLKDQEPLRAECQHFLECVRDRKTPRTNGEEGLRVLRVLHVCERSLAAEGQPTLVEVTARPYFVHPTAVIDSPCEIGEGTKIWHFSHIMAGCRIGRSCNLGQNVLVSAGCSVGDNVKIQNNVSVYTGVELEDNVFCGPSMVFTNVINPRSHVVRRDEYRRTLVKRGATLGANSTILCGCTIGQYAFVAAGSVVTRDIPDYSLVMGVPARHAGWMCQCGVRLALPAAYSGSGTQPLACPSCGATFELTQQGLRRLS
jgi:UDP-2-acetamido-3-amino-2,3-dideoxy-glucuronate N-acetyltransferase